MRQHRAWVMLAAVTAGAGLAVAGPARPAFAAGTEPVAVGLGRDGDSRVLQVTAATAGARVGVSTYQVGAPGGPVDLQRWTLELSVIEDIEDTSVYRIRNVATGLCLHQETGGVGAAVTVQPCSAAAAQQWMTPYGGAYGGINLQSLSDFRCLEVADASGVSGALLQTGNCVTDWQVDDWFQRWRLRYGSFHCDRYSSQRLLTGLCVDTAPQPMFGAMGVWRNLPVSVDTAHQEYPNAVENFLEIRSLNTDNADESGDGVEFGLRASTNPNAPDTYYPYWLEWGDGTEELVSLADQPGATEANSRLHTYMLLGDDDSGEWDVLYDFNTVGVTRLQEGSRLQWAFTGTAVAQPLYATVSGVFENRMQLLDGNQEWRRPRLGEVSRSEPKTCEALPSEVDPYWDMPNLPPWCLTTELVTRTVPGNPTQVESLRIGKPGGVAVAAAGPTVTSPSRVTPGGVVNGVDQQVLAGCLDTDPTMCLTTVPGLRDCVAARKVCNTTLARHRPPAGTAMTLEQARQTARHLFTGRSGTAPTVAGMQAETVTATDYGRVAGTAVTRALTAGSTVHVIRGDGPVAGLAAAGTGTYERFVLAFDAQSGALVHACLGRACPKAAR